MDSISVNSNIPTSSTRPFASVSFMPDARTSYQLPISSPLTSQRISGHLLGNKWLTRPLTVDIKYDDREVIVSEPRFHIHAFGTTITKAIEEFKRVISEELDDLTEDEEELGPRLQEELQYLRELIRTA